MREHLIPGGVTSESEREDARLAAVHRYAILDTPADGSFDNVTALAAQIFDVPIAIVSIVDRDRIWFKSHHGLNIEEIGRDPGLCASAILQSEPWVVTDAGIDPRVLTSPLVAGEFGLRFYAGAPLTTRDGHNLGTLCVIDYEPREVTEAELDSLKRLALVVVNEMELRLSVRRAMDLERRLRRQSQDLATAFQQVALPDSLPQVPGLAIEAFYRSATTARVGGDWYDAFVLDDDTVAVNIGDVAGHGFEAAATMGQIRNAVRAYASQEADPAIIASQLDSLVEEIEGARFATLAHFMIDTNTGVFRAVNAGHLPPILVRDNTCSLLDWPPAPPIGAHVGYDYQSIAGVLAPNDRMFLYTDGLVERRGETIDDGIGRLLSTMRSSDNRNIFRAAVSLADGRHLDDDVAALMIGRSGVPAPMGDSAPSRHRAPGDRA